MTRSRLTPSPSRLTAILALLLLLLLPLPGSALHIQIGDYPAPADKDEPAIPAPPASHMGSHGMALFGGKDSLYASHLPMFHAPHDVQVIVRLHLQDAKKDGALRRQLAKHPQLWTLDPEKFDLQRLQPGHSQPLTQFTANFVQGHFERGGKLRYAAQTVVIDQVLLYHLLTPGFKQADLGRYLVIGSGSEHFVVKHIDRRPDFDIIRVLDAPANAALPEEILLPNGQNPRTMRAPDAKAWQAALKPFGSKLRIGKTLYFETGDLQ